MTPAALRRQRGQALTELLVLAAVLLPLFLLMPLLAKYQDMAGQAQLASRYVTFDAITRNAAQSSWKPPEQLAAEVRRRFFSNAAAPVKTGDVAGNFAAHQNPSWRGPGGTPLIADFNADVSVSFGPAEQPDQAGAFHAADDGKPFNQLAGAVGVADRLGLGNRGIHTGNVAIRLARLPAALTLYQPFDRLDLVLRRHASVVIDGWTASGPAQVQARIDDNALVPATALRGAASKVGASVSLVEAGHVAGPRLGELAFWSDVVPSDRLK